MTDPIQCHLDFVLWQNVSHDTTSRVQVLGKQETFHCFVLNSHFIQRLNVKMFFLFACLLDCKYILFPCISDICIWSEIFFLHSFEGKSSCATNSTIVAEKNQNYFLRTLPTAKIKIREKYYPCFWDKTVNIWRRKNIPVYGIACQSFPISDMLYLFYCNYT